MTPYNLLSIYFFVMLIAVIFSAAYIKSLNTAAYSYATMLLSFAISTYIFGYLMELNSVSISQILFWNYFEYLGIPFISALWLCVALMYTGYFSRHKKLFCALIFSVPVLTLILRFTNSHNNLYFLSLDFLTVNGKLMMVKKTGIGMMIQSAHSMLMIISALFVLVYSLFTNKEKSYGKVVFMVFASFFALFGLLLSLIRPFGFILDYMAVCLPVSCLMVILAILRYDFLEAKSRARSKAFESSEDAMLLINAQNKIIDYNTSARMLLERLGINISYGYVGVLFRDAPDLLKKITYMKSSVLKLNVDSQERYFEISTKKIRNKGSIQGWIKTIRDTTETHELNEYLKRQALMDELSGVHNRRAFMKFGSRMMLSSFQENQPVHMLMMDLDHFKQVNDLYGHQAGDMVIQYIGENLRKIFEPDCLIARLGGEEFGILMYGFTDAQVTEKAQAMLETAYGYEYVFLDKKFHVTVSIGIAGKIRSSQTLENMINMADKALYCSKDKGRNYISWYNADINGQPKS